MSKVAVVYFSSTGNTEQMAFAVEEGAKSAGLEVETFAVSDAAALNPADYDGFALGCSAMGNEELDEGEFRPFFEGVLPELKDMPLDEITSGVILKICRKIEASGHIETAAHIKEARFFDTL